MSYTPIPFDQIESARRRWTTAGHTVARANIDIYEISPDDPFTEPCWHIDGTTLVLSTRDLVTKTPTPIAPNGKPNGRQATPDNGLAALINATTAATPATPASPHEENLPLKLLRRDGGTQPRAALDNETLAEYVEAMAAGAKFPAVEVFYDGHDYWLVDGFHRVNAALTAGRTQINATVIAGTQRDAILYSAGANARHGLRRTNADKRRAVERLLRDDEWVKWSDREIARRCIVTQPFVSKLRSELTDNGYQSENATTFSTVRRGADGRTYNTEHIGHTRATTSEPDQELHDATPTTLRALLEHINQTADIASTERAWMRDYLISAGKTRNLRISPEQAAEAIQSFIDNQDEVSRQARTALTEPTAPAPERLAQLISAVRAWLQFSFTYSGGNPIQLLQGILARSTPAQIRDFGALSSSRFIPQSTATERLLAVQALLQELQAATPQIPDLQTPVTASNINIICADARTAIAGITSPVNLIITSPPYNTGVIAYDGHNDALDQFDYDQLLETVWAACIALLAPGGRICVNVPFGMGRSPWVPVTPRIYAQLYSAGLQIEGQIIWDKGTSGNSTAWGSWGRPTNPVLRDTCEAIIIASRAGEPPMPRSILVPATNNPGALVSPWLQAEGIFMQLTQDHWQIAPESATRIGHPAPFPVKLAENLIRLYGWPGCHILDPFAGSGTTAVAALGLPQGDQCRITLIEQSPTYCQLATDRIAQRAAQPELKGIAS